jgi:hypothetical protein
MATYFDRYEQFKTNGTVLTLPFIKLTPKSTDKRVVYKLGETRLDKLSQTYYNNPYHGFLIMLANPEYGGLEFNIKDGDIIRIPFPFNATIEDYNNQVQTFITLYGNR